MALSNLDCLDPLVEEVHVLREDMYISWFWVKAHILITGNEAADWLA